MKIVIITGMSGAGKSQAVKVFEDMGYYVVDNLPPNLLGKFVEVLTTAEGRINDAALVMDIRSGKFSVGIEESIDELIAKNIAFEILFLDADDAAIVRRQESVRRPLPLQGEHGLLDGAERERRMLATLRASADLVIDTSNLNVHQLSDRVAHAFGGDDDPDLGAGD